MRGLLPLLALGACLAAGALPAAAGDTENRIWVESYPPGFTQGGDTTEDGGSTPRPSGPTVEQAADGVSVVRGGYTNPPTIEEAADGVTVVRGPGSGHP
jgi:hypothetical protein